jgi:hypothetical protein
MKDANVRPNAVFGVMSPYDTVVMLLTAQYSPTGMLVNPFSAPSIKYMRVPLIYYRHNHC